MQPNYLNEQPLLMVQPIQEVSMHLIVPAVTNKLRTSGFDWSDKLLKFKIDINTSNKL
jgi:hypothetical protein